ncbi:hypothetical protein SFRURICE_017316 [Spodoptera frugiperda]|nr:hypothetical protein SFRURICE_017316 [Spodoptera frugiperda]
MKFKEHVTNIFLVNLSAADLLVTGICMPIQLSKAITLVWFYGETVCKIVNYIQGVAVAASVFTITAMSVDRWLSISPEPRLRPPGRKQALLLLFLLWCAALLIFIPLLMVATVRREPVPIISKALKNISIETRDVHFCTEEWPGMDRKKQFGMLSFTLVYAIPGIPGSSGVLSLAVRRPALTVTGDRFAIPDARSFSRDGWGVRRFVLLRGPIPLAPHQGLNE